MERTFVLLKPDLVQRGLVGEVFTRIERRGLRIAAMKMIAISRSLAEEHYVEHQTKAFYEALIAYITAGPCIALVVEGPHAIEIMRKMIGSTDPREAQSGTIRGDFAISLQYNTIHGSDSQAAADREIQLFFTPDEIFAYGGGVDAWRP